ncbi:MAG: sulfatase-like hydrolase/transferase [Thermoguttaceae bacterium]|nr:sulfatase-like hydrolase/transferase [Thermoguttaceae bacterium]MDW8078197.1 sulfatase-like hydrolase/transferase [Thermoguttaceae bacterium]
MVRLERLRYRGSFKFAWLLASLGVGTLAVWGQAAQPQLGDRPFPVNVLLIIGDDQGWTDFGFMGHAVIRTPHLDRLASQSLVFTRGYVPSSLCRPSLGTLVTGLYPHQHRLTCNDPPQAGTEAERLALREEQIRYIDRLPTLPRLLAQRGYLSLQTGKWWEGHYSRGGFTHGMTHGDPKRGGRHGDEGLRIGREGLEPIFRFIRECGERPFFIWYAPYLPHEPHNPPPAILEKYRRLTDSPYVAAYWAMCEWFDQTCGQLLDHLEQTGLAQRTLVVFVVDNGWIQNPTGRGFAPKSKRSPYDGGLRTPIMLRLPGVIEPRRDDVTPVSTVDIVPTILRVCGVDVPPELPGSCLLDPEALQRRAAIFGATFTHEAVDVHNPAANLMYRWTIEGWWKLIVPHRANVAEGKPELYNLKEDPHESRNLIDEHPEVYHRLLQRIEGWWSVP